MNADSPSPVLLIAGVNRNAEPRRQKIIAQELEAVGHSVHTGSGSHALRVVPEIPEEGIYLFDHFRQYQYQPEVAFLHLSGFLNGRYLRFDGTLGDETMDPVGFADMIGRLPGLQAVFLNGCGHRELIEQLLLRDIPGIISLDSAGSSRKLNREAARKFYQELQKGASVREAWLAVQVEFAGKLVYRKVHYDLETDTLNWKGRNPDSPDAEWGLYVLEENEHKLDWALPVESGQSASAGMPYAPPANPKRNSRSLRRGILATASLALVAAITWATIHYDIPGYLRNLFAADTPCAFFDEEPYNILQLPFHPKGDCDKADPSIADAITRRLERLEDQADDEGDFQVKYLAGECPVELDHVEDLIRTCKADVVLWGEYDRSAPGEILFHFRYLYSTGEMSLDRGQMTVRMPEEQVLADNDFISSGIEEVIFWARGNAHFSRQEHKDALKYLSKIREQPTDNYLRVDVRMAQCYVELGQFDKALERYNHMLAIDPDNPMVFNDRGQLHFQMKNYEDARHEFEQAILIQPDYADALYNRGLVYMQEEAYSDAISDLQTVIRIQPRAGRPYGALAAIYAELKDEENLYASLERALERGEDIEDLLFFFSSLRKYKHEERFSALVGRFR